MTEKDTQSDEFPGYERIIHSLCILDAESLMTDLQKDSELLMVLERIVAIFKFQGYSRLISSKGDCSCMAIEKHCVYVAETFFTESQVHSDHPQVNKEFTLVFIQNTETLMFDAIKFCAHMDWRKTHEIYI
jgi:hypothetical protein